MNKYKVDKPTTNSLSYIYNYISYLKNKMI